MTKSDKDELVESLRYRNGTDNSKLVDHFKMIANGRQYLSVGAKKVIIAEMDDSQKGKLVKYVKEVRDAKAKALTDGKAVPFPKGETPDLANIEAIIADWEFEGATPEFYQKYKGEAIFLTAGEPESRETSKTRSEIFREMEKFIPAKERIHFPNWILNDTNYIFNRIIENDNSVKSEYSTQIHEKWGRLTIKNTGNAVKDWATFYDSLMVCLSEFERVDDPPKHGRKLNKIQDILLSDSRFSSTVQTWMSTDKWKSTNNESVLKLLEKLDTLYRIIFSREKQKALITSSGSGGQGGGTDQKKLCTFQANGNCNYGDNCRRDHDPKRIAAWLKKKKENQSNSSSTSNSNGSGTQATGSTYVEKRKCKKCGKKGHIKKDCRAKIDDGNNESITIPPPGAAPAAAKIATTTQAMQALASNIDEDQSKELIALLASTESGKKALQGYQLNLVLGQLATTESKSADEHYALMATDHRAVTTVQHGISRQGGKGWAKRERRRQEQQHQQDTQTVMTDNNNDTDTIYTDSSDYGLDPSVYDMPLVTDFGTSSETDDSSSSYYTSDSTTSKRQQQRLTTQRHKRGSRRGTTKNQRRKTKMRRNMRAGKTRARFREEQTRNEPPQVKPKKTRSCSFKKVTETIYAFFMMLLFAITGRLASTSSQNADGDIQSNLKDTCAPLHLPAAESFTYEQAMMGKPDEHMQPEEILAVMDSGCTRTMVCNIDRLSGTLYKISVPVNGIDKEENVKEQLCGVMAGDYELVFKHAGKYTKKIIRDAMFVPGIPHDLISERELCRTGLNLHRLKLGTETILSDKKNRTVFRSESIGGLYYFKNHITPKQRHPVFLANILDDVEDISDTISAKSYLANTFVGNMNLADLLHVRLGHISQKNSALNSRLKAAYGDAYKSSSKLAKFCKACVYGKAHKQTFPKRARRDATRPLERVWFDCIGKVPVPGNGGFNYLLVFVDEYTGAYTLTPLKDRTQVFSEVKNFVKQSELHYKGRYSFGQFNIWPEVYIYYV